MFQDEKIVETKICKHCGINFDITYKDLEFYEKISPNFWGKKYLFPTPNLCPDCRQQRRLSFRNERKLYKRKCDASGKEIISMYSPDKKYTVYDQNFWWSDWWDALKYWREFDFSKSFFEQFDELMKVIPRYSLYNFDNENCEYVNYMPHSKNCYLVFWWWYNQECYYWDTFLKSKNCIDWNYIFNSELCYEWVYIDWCYKCFYIFNSMNSKNSYFIYDCDNCENCIWCWNLKNKKLYIFNKKVSKKEFEEKKKEIFRSKISLELFSSKYFEVIKSKSINRFFQWNGNIKVTWDYLYNCKNVINWFIWWDSENISHSWRFSGKNCLDLSWCWNSEVMLECWSCDYWFKLWHSIDSESCKESFYLNLCNNTSKCFWCIWLKNKEYCILNKQYTKEEYDTLVPKIIEYMQKTWEWWEFFPSSISPFGYNETVANEYFPLARDVALQHLSEDWKQLFNWSDYETPFPKVEKIIPASKLPENISEIPDDILNWAIECEVTKKPFRIIKQELEFYRKYNLPIPRKSPDQRHLERMALRNPRKLFTRVCDKCGKEIQTTYTPEREETVYCEECYNREIY